jgi:DNA (cytosine-5)-methyltransferase 1
MEQTFPTISAIDLFCGAGGLTHGLILEGIEVRAGIDTDPACKYPFKRNNKGAKFIKKSVKNVGKRELAKFYKKGEIRLLAGCAPCQPFSTFSFKYEKKKKEDLENGLSLDQCKDDRWSLLGEFARLVDELDPDIVTMENVPQLQKHKIFENFVAFLKKDDRYRVTCEVVDCSKYGMPQRRKRLVLLASKKGKIELPDESQYKDIDNSLAGAIKGLSEIAAGAHDPKDRLHKARYLSETNLKRIRASKPGGTWRDWNEELLPNCYKQPSGQSFQSVYGRMTWDEPSSVITTQFHNYGTGRFGHPEQDRAISIREAALIQTFPPSYKFVKKKDPVLITNLGRLIGNAVPVDLGRIIAKSIKNHVKAYYGKK